MSEIVNPPLVVIPASTATDFTTAPTLNAQNEPVVDMIAGTDNALLLVAWLNPGKQVGDELIVRMIRRTGSVSGGTDTGNKASIRLKVLSPGSRMQHLTYEGFDDYTTQFDFPAFPGTPYPGQPQLVIFRWSGTSWLPILTDLP